MNIKESWVDSYFSLEKISEVIKSKEQDSVIIQLILHKLVEMALEHPEPIVRNRCVDILSERDEKFVIDGLYQVVLQEKSITIKEKCIPALVKKIKH